MKEYLIKQKNSFSFLDFQVYEKDKEVGSFNAGNFIFKNNKFQIPTSCQPINLIRIIKLPEKKEVGKIILTVENVLILATISSNRIIIGKEEYEAVPSGKLRINVRVLKKGADEPVVEYTQQGWFAKKDVIKFSDIIKEKDHPIFIGLLMWLILSNGAK